MPRRKGEDTTFLEYQLFRIGRALESLFGKVEQVSNGQAEITAALEKVGAVIDALVAKLQSQPNAPDFESEIQTLQNVRDELASAGKDDSANESAASEETPAEAPAEAPASGQSSAEVGAPEAPEEAPTAEAPGAGEAPPEPPPTGQ